jgi:hypothetical protein
MDDNGRLSDNVKSGKEMNRKEKKRKESNSENKKKKKQTKGRERVEEGRNQ